MCTSTGLFMIWDSVEYKTNTYRLILIEGHDIREERVYFHAEILRLGRGGKINKYMDETYWPVLANFLA
jgi:hypothetical protein